MNKARPPMISLNRPAAASSTRTPAPEWRWLFAYDVAGTRQRQRVARRLERAGLRVQKSVFLVLASRSEASRLFERLSGLIEADRDQLNAWRLAADSRCQDDSTLGTLPHMLERDVLIW